MKQQIPMYLCFIVLVIILFKGIDIKIDLKGENRINLSNACYERLNVATH